MVVSPVMKKRFRQLSSVVMLVVYAFFFASTNLFYHSHQLADSKVVHSHPFSDREGIVLYQNERAIRRDGDVTGKNLYNCHGEKAGQMIRHMMETGVTNTYQIIRHGKHKLLHQTPWFDESGAVAGLIELAIDLPDNMRVLDRDNV